MPKKKKSKKKSSIFKDLKKEIPKSKSLGYNALHNLQLNSENVLGDFTKELLDSNSSITDKIALIQSLENIALAETVKSFDPKTRDVERLGASNRLLSISRQLKTTLKDKYNLELQEVVDFTNPKFSMAFTFLIEIFVNTMKTVGLEDNTILRIVDTLTVSTDGFEDRLNELFKGVPLHKVRDIKNPFIQDVKVEELDYIELEQIEDSIEYAEIEDDKEDRKAKRRAKRKAKRESKK